MTVVNIILIMLVPAITYLVFMLVQGAKNKILTVLGGTAAFLLIMPFLLSVNEKAAQASIAQYPTGKATPTVGITLKNYKEQGDSVNLECSGSTGNITCKPKK